jgi:hypothetical protein
MGCPRQYRSRETFLGFLDSPEQRGDMFCSCLTMRTRPATGGWIRRCGNFHPHSNLFFVRGLCPWLRESATLHTERKHWKQHETLPQPFCSGQPFMVVRTTGSRLLVMSRIPHYSMKCGQPLPSACVETRTQPSKP